MTSNTNTYEAKDFDLESRTETELGEVVFYNVKYKGKPMNLTAASLQIKTHKVCAVYLDEVKHTSNTRQFGNRLQLAIKMTTTRYEIEQRIKTRLAMLCNLDGIMESYLYAQGE